MKKWLATAKPGNRGESLRTLQEVSDRAYVRGTMVDKEPVLRTKNGRSFAFSPEWYPDLVKMCNASLDMLGFGPEMVLALATDVYATKMLIDEKDAPMYTPSHRRL